MYYVASVLSGLIWVFVACSTQTEQTQRSNRTANSADAQRCTIEQISFPEVTEDQRLEHAQLENEQKVQKSICEIQTAYPDVSLTIYNMLSKSSGCSDCWDELYNLIKVEQNKSKLDVLTYYVLDTFQFEVSDFYAPLATTFGILRDANAFFAKQRPLNSERLPQDVIFFVNQYNKAFYITQAAMETPEDRQNVLVQFSAYLQNSLSEKHTPPTIVDPMPDTTENNEEISLDPLAEGLSAISISEMRTQLAHISDDKFQGRLSATTGNSEVASYLKEFLIKQGAEPLQSSGYEQRFTMSVGPTYGKQTANLIAKIEGTDDVLKNEYIVIGAHMDHAGTLNLGYTCSAGPDPSDKICNGADDNGSGSIAVLQVMKALTSVRKHLKRSVLVVWFSGEEEGLLGAYHFVNNPLVQLSKIKYMVNLDMVGSIHTNNKRLGALGALTSSAASNILKDIGSRSYPYTIQSTTSAGGGSDHVPFMNKGIPGVFFHTGVINNENYHRTSDSADKISYEGVEFAAKVAFELVFRMANHTTFTREVDGERTPLLAKDELNQSCGHHVENIYSQMMGVFK